MTIESWLEQAYADADRRGLPQLKPLLTGLAGATRILRAADWNESAEGGSRTPASSPGGARKAASGGESR